MKSMKKLVLTGLVLLTSVVVLAGCKMEPEGQQGPQGQKVYKFTSEPRILSDYKSPNNTDSEWTYVAFGDWPQTIKADDVEVTEDESTKKEMGMFTYYLGSDGNYYVKVTANPYREGYKYSDGSVVEEGEVVYFKVEPIVWRVLTEDYKVPGEGGELQSTHNALLLAENILTGGIRYYVNENTRTITGAGTKEGEPDTVYSNNYKYSTIRAWLNGKYEADDTQAQTYSNKGFLQTAFTETARDQIADTEVDNSARSTNPDSDANQWDSGANPYASETKTKDKIFLLSVQEATKADYGFAKQIVGGNTRIRVSTDYVKATGALQSAGNGSWWWLRSPSSNDESNVRFIYHDGDANSYYYVTHTNGGVVPALSISLQ